ncbi:MAG: hypothetical protein OEZ27_05525 [Nitrospinota bacterium]|nr:hypothetical protein [Nitrospinota bacterium]
MKGLKSNQNPRPAEDFTHIDTERRPSCVARLLDDISCFLLRGIALAAFIPVDDDRATYSAHGLSRASIV